MQHLQKTRGRGCALIPLWSRHITGTLTQLISFICHTYENTGVWGYSSHFGTPLEGVSPVGGLPATPSKPARTRVLSSAVLSAVQRRKRAGNDRARP